jgi:hypothetical protein
MPSKALQSISSARLSRRVIGQPTRSATFAARFEVTVDTVSTTTEDMVFPLPRELRSEAAE